MNTTTLKHIGDVDVESGQVLIGDPGYLRDFLSDEYHGGPGHVGEYPYSYSGACEASLSGGGPLASFMAVTSSTGYGDGIYPVFQIITDGVVTGLFIDFADEDG